MYVRQCLYQTLRKGGWTRDTGLAVRLGGSGTLIAHFPSRFRLFSDLETYNMSKKALILIADGTEEMEL